jgi:hypothetical protein
MHPVYRSFIGLLAIILTGCPVYAQTTPTFDSAYGSTGSSDGLFDTPFGIVTDAAGSGEYCRTACRGVHPQRIRPGEQSPESI